MPSARRVARAHVVDPLGDGQDGEPGEDAAPWPTRVWVPRHSAASSRVTASPRRASRVATCASTSPTAGVVPGRRDGVRQRRAVGRTRRRRATRCRWAARAGTTTATATSRATNAVTATRTGPTTRAGRAAGRSPRWCRARRSRTTTWSPRARARTTGRPGPRRSRPQGSRSGASVAGVSVAGWPRVLRRRLRRLTPPVAIHAHTVGARTLRGACGHRVRARWCRSGRQTTRPAPL